MAKSYTRNRLCSECHVLEDEYHVICVCSRYTDLRNKFIKQYYVEKPSMFKFIQLINSENVTEMQKLASFIKSLFNSYNIYLFS